RSCSSARSAIRRWRNCASSIRSSTNCSTKKAIAPKPWRRSRRTTRNSRPLSKRRNTSRYSSPGKKVSLVQEWAELDTRKLLHGQVWRLLTHAFCHERFGVFHILFNMLFLYWWGCTIESMYGTREFLAFYLTAAVVAGLAFVGLDLWTGSRIS